MGWHRGGYCRHHYDVMRYTEKKCEVAGCSERAVIGKWRCQKYIEEKRLGICSTMTCKNKIFRKGLCYGCYELQLSWCQVAGCDDVVEARDMCSTYYRQYMIGKDLMIKRLKKVVVVRTLPVSILIADVVSDEVISTQGK